MGTDLAYPIFFTAAGTTFKAGIRALGAMGTALIKALQLFFKLL